MKKIINSPEMFVDETMEGIVAAYGDRVKFFNGDKRILLSNSAAPKGKVGVVTAGGSGHLPVFLGYVGEGMLDGCAVGNVFASPAYTKMADMIRACDRGGGVLCLLGNYGGDVMNMEQAREDVEFDDIVTKAVYVADDICSAPREKAEKRRGIAGMVYAFKIAGAAAAKMMTLEEVADITERALSNIRSIGAAISPCVIPEVGTPTFTIKENEIEIGMGIHGEKGIVACEMMKADELVRIMMDQLLTDMPLFSGEEVSVMVNGLGATPLEEQFIIFRKIKSILDEMGVGIYMPHIGEYATSMEMAGFSITLLKLDKDLKDLLRVPAVTPFYTNLNK